MKLKKLAAAVVVSASLSLASPLASADGIPTVDFAAIAHMVDQLNQMKTQYAMLESQYKQLQTMTEKLEGYSGIGENIMMDVLKELHPEVYDFLNGLTVENFPERAMEIFEERGFDKACGIEKGLKLTSVQEKCKQEYLYVAGAEYMFEQSAKNASKRGEKLNELMNQAQNVQTQKEAADLQIRISGEQASLQLAQYQADQTARAIEQAERNNKESRRQDLKRSFWGHQG
ncbi:type IV secretion system protein [Anaerobiospirillum sp. NML120511]|uniref:type IV secretion system protein n=1 Tax=Anaerobiospirillum sp. NML120511 TaxID=2932819 RepID=UPI001FF69BFC|nr:type IV secretion system protein [Anaerobiospirillum sp. NML120511]MCK0535745.1 type IV secretion system protein [Anaerobiospirillum sp. NML120511]